MIGRADDAVLFCLIAAALVVIAHLVDGVGARRRDEGGWANSLALALCGLALGLVAVGAAFSTNRTDLLISMSTAAAVVVSAMPLVGLRTAEDAVTRPAEPRARPLRHLRRRTSTRPRRPFTTSARSSGTWVVCSDSSVATAGAGDPTRRRTDGGHEKGLGTMFRGHRSARPKGFEPLTF